METRKANRVSTHAPARGATQGHTPRGDVIMVSTHAPARGATVERKVAVLRAVKHQISRTSLEREAAEPCYKTKACKSPVKAVLRIPLENQDHLRFAVRNQVINTPSGS